MKQVWFTKDRTIDVLDVEEPGSPPYGKIKVKTAYASLCASDLHMVTMGILGATPGMPLGHEASGVIAEMGPGTEKSGLKVGDKVVICPDSICFMCVNCKDGKDVRCKNGSPVFAFSEYMISGAGTTFKVPDDGDLKHYALTEPLGCVLHAMELANIQHGQSVLLTGVGGIGIIMLNAVLLSGAAKITVSEPVAEKRKTALSMGAQYVIDPANENFKDRCMEITNGKGFDYIFEMSGVPAVAPTCFDVAAHGCKITYFAVYPPDFVMPVNLYDMYRKEINIQCLVARILMFPRAVELIPRLQMDKIIGPIFPLTKAVEAFELFKKSIHHKILLDCNI